MDKNIKPDFKALSAYYANATMSFFCTKPEVVWRICEVIEDGWEQYEPYILSCEDNHFEIALYCKSIGRFLQWGDMTTASTMWGTMNGIEAHIIYTYETVLSPHNDALKDISC